MPDRTIGELPVTSSLLDNILVPVERNSVAHHITLKQIKDYTLDGISTGGGGTGNGGADGKSAYEIAQENGYTGTVTEWLESLKGKDGVSPTISVTTITGGHRITITDATGSKSFDVMDGASGGSDNGGGTASIPTASATTLGGIKVGEGLKISSSGVLSLDFNYKDIVTIPGGGYINLVGDGWGNAPYEIEMSKSDSGSGSGTITPTPETCTVTTFNEVDGVSIKTGEAVYNYGETILLSASASGTFLHWKNGSGEIVSTTDSYTFTVTEDVTLTAVFTTGSVTPPQPSTSYTVSLSVDPSGSGTTTGAGSYTSGSSVTVSATATSGYTFSGWNKNGVIVSTNASYTFTISGDVSLTAVFESATTAPVLTWKTATINSYDFRDVAFGKNRFIAVAFGSGDGVAYSTDYGKAWQHHNVPYNIRPRCIAYGSGTFVILGSSGANHYVLLTQDGTNFTAYSNMPGDTQTWGNVIHTGEKFIAICETGDEASHSSDGLNWTLSDLPFSATWSDLAYGDGKIVALAYGTNRAIYSTDNGVTWNMATLPISGNWHSVAYGDGMFVGVGESGKIVWSTDATNWHNSPSLGAHVYRIIYAANMFVTSAGILFRDGEDFEVSSVPPISTATGIAYGSGTFVAVTNNGTTRAAYANV